MTPLKYRREAGISGTEIINAVKEAGFQRFDGPAMSLVENGERSGVTLCKAGATAVKSKFPAYFATLPFLNEKSEPKRKDSRTSENRFSFRTTGEFANRLRAAKAESGKTMQDFILEALDERISRMKKTAPGAATPETAGKKDYTSSINWIKEEVK